MFYCLFFSSASVIPEVHCLISPHRCLPPRGRVDLLIGSCDQTYGGTKHRPELPGDKSRLVGFFPLFRRWGAEHPRIGLVWPLDDARCKQTFTALFRPFQYRLMCIFLFLQPIVLFSYLSFSLKLKCTPYCDFEASSTFHSAIIHDHKESSRTRLLPWSPHWHFDLCNGA